MKKTISIALAAMMIAAALAGCASIEPGLDPQIRITSSDAESAAQWLDQRLDSIPDRIVIGTDADNYNVDLAALEDDGYIIRNLGGEVAIFARTADGLDRAVRKYAKMAEAGDGVINVTMCGKTLISLESARGGSTYRIDFTSVSSTVPSQKRELKNLKNAVLQTVFVSGLL